MHIFIDLKLIKMAPLFKEINQKLTHQIFNTQFFNYLTFQVHKKCIIFEDEVI